MARITDPDNLNQGVEVDFITGSKLIRLNEAGNLSTDGVSLQTLYSFIKEEWKDDDNLIKFPIPMLAITSEQFELINGWNFSGSTADASGSQAFVRDGGWAVVSSSGGNVEEYMNITTLGLFDNQGTDIAYYLQQDEAVAGFGVATPVDIFLAGPVNQGIKIYGSGSGGNFDYRAFFRIYLREQGKTYGFGDLLVDQNLSALTYRKYAVPLTNGSDLKVTETDGNIASQAPYTGMSITYYTESQSRTLGATGTFEFDVVIAGNQGTAEEIYEFVQWSLRQTTDIDADAGEQKRGDIQSELLLFIGDTLRTSEGVYIDDFQSIDTNRLEFTPTGSTTQVTFPFVAAGTINFNDNLSGDSAAIFKLFFTNDDAPGDNNGFDFGTENAIIINNNSGSSITGSVNGSSSLQFDYDYDGNIQRGSVSSGSDAPVTAVSIGLGTAQYVVTTTTITRSTSNAVNFVAALERNYLNPV
jgi:hypothetical protein